MKFDNQLDTSGLLCPLPLLKTKQALATMQSGQVLHVITTDPSSVIDFTVFVDRTDHEMVHEEVIDEVYHYYIRVGGFA